MPEEPVNSPQLRGKLPAFFYNPWVAVVGSLCSILGVVYVLYAVLFGGRSKELTYYAYPLKTVVARSGELSNLKVLHEGREVKHDVTSVQIAVWNAGDEPIRLADTLEKIQIKTLPQTSILEVRILDVTRHVVGFNVNPSFCAEGRLPISWTILEKNDGALLQVVFEGPPSVGLRVEGTLVGQKEITPVATRFAVRLFGSPDSIDPWTNLILAPGLAFLMGGIIAIPNAFLLIYFIRERKLLIRRNARRFFWFAVICFILSVAFGLYVVISFSSVPIPPF
jgi:hypothetical protein